MISAGALVKRTRAPCLSGLAPGSSFDDRVGEPRLFEGAGVTSAWPRAISSTSTPPRLIAVRCPATASAARARAPARRAPSRASARRQIELVVDRRAARDQRAGDDGAEPFIENTRSIGSRSRVP
jgi:hypothetical protein